AVWFHARTVSPFGALAANAASTVPASRIEREATPSFLTATSLRAAVIGGGRESYTNVGGVGESFCIAAHRFYDDAPVRRAHVVQARSGSGGDYGTQVDRASMRGEGSSQKAPMKEMVGFRSVTFTQMRRWPQTSLPPVGGNAV